MRALLIIVMLFGILNAQNREALLIGNKNYSYLENLQNPRPSMTRLKKTLEKLGFHVTVKYDLDAENLLAEVEKFRDRLSSNTIGFFYYSGHGCQINNQSYLIPTNVDTRNPSKVKYHALSIGELLDTLNRANNKLNMLFLDACRDVPIGAKGGKKGLGQINTTPKGTLVVYATEAGKTANDNTLFINKLRETLLQPNQKILDIANNLSNLVASKTSDTQIPEVFFKKLPSHLVLLKAGYVPPVPPKPVPEPKPVPVSTSKWINPSNSVCKANGGEFYKGVCYANWKDAQKICRVSGGRLPTIDELNKVVTACGGEVTKDWISHKIIQNNNNSNYQNCYKEKGFIFYYYWSSTTNARYTNYAWGVNFGYGYTRNYSKSYNSYVRCVRAGQ